METPATHLVLDCAFAGTTLVLARAEGPTLTPVASHTSAMPKSSDELAPALHRLMEETHTQASNLQSCIVTVGPGSFTGARLGLAVAEALKLVNPALTLQGLSTLQAVAWQVQAQGGEEEGAETVTVLLDAAGGQAFCQTFGPGATPQTQAVCLPLAEALANPQGILAAQSTLMLAEAHEPVSGLTPQTLCACAANPTFHLPAQPVYIKPLAYKTAGDTQIAIGTTPTFLAEHATNWHNPLMTKDEVATQLAQPHHALLWHPGGAHLLAALPPAGVADVLTLFTPEVDHRKGQAATLLTFLKSLAQKAGCSAITLEVRAGNTAAIATYTRMGFVQVSVRKEYYTNPVEDALVFSLNLS